MEHDNSLPSRRQFLKGAGLAGVASTLAPFSGQAQSKKAGGKAKNLIFLVVDGMCNGTLGLAHHWNLREKGKLLNWMQLYERPGFHRSLQDTASLSSPVTDSAAAASAWGCGQRVNNGAINTDEKGRPVEPIFVRAKKSGKRVGLVSTCRISHATPAGFVANVPNRDQEDAIVAQYLERGVDLLLGGGARKFKQRSKSGQNVDYLHKFKDAGYRIVRDSAALKRLSADGKPLLGIFSDSHVPFAIDRQNDPSLRNTPGLAEMFRASLDQLGDSEKGFVLQVEAGRVDHAGHANDPGAILHEQLEFDACIPIALDYIQKDPDTLLIVTTDHGTGGCQLDGLGRRYRKSGPALEQLGQFKHSFEWLGDRFREEGEFDSDLFRLATGITPTEAQAIEFQKALKDSGVSYLSNVMTRVFEKELTSKTATGWSSRNHTAENVELLAVGPGSEKLPGFIRNEELFGVMTKALGI